MNGWFPHINRVGQIASGSSEVWVDDALVTTEGGNPFWLGTALGYSNRKDGDAARVILPTGEIKAGYNVLTGSDDTRWAGFFAPGEGRLDIYAGLELARRIEGGCSARFAPGAFAFIHPFQSTYRALILNEVVVDRGAIVDSALYSDGFIVWCVADGYRYTLKTASGDVNIRDDETLVAAFFGPDEQRWLVTATQTGTLVRPMRSHMGYRIVGDLYYPDARMIGARLRVVGSTENGDPLFDNWIDFDAERIDLRANPPIQPPIPPIEPPVEPPIEPPIEPPVEPGPTPPNPEPPPVEDPVLAYAPPVPGFLSGEEVVNGDGTISVKKPNGKYLCVTPEGRVEERDSPGGLWESFKKGKASLIAERDGGARGPVVYVLPLAE